ncbi:low-specificity L-threonine aldolase [Amphibiibacter pelophylacis]|uniref:Low-specificity L-threonine aldolase n=1 Tax=Amphibiibacter pelophylacis TaxID=1799477 RepID=A0ACC6P4Y2_9BURK
MSDYGQTAATEQDAAPRIRHDWRSDTVTRPTPAMQAAMARAMADPAQIGDDVFGDDPTVLALQTRLAGLLGKEAALFVPSGTQSNLCALMAHCGRGDEVLAGQLAHIYRYEAGGGAVLGSIQPQPLPQQADGTLRLDDIAAAIKPDDEHFARTRLLCLENTWNGHALPLDDLQDACALARQHGLATHLDGARLFNAAVAGVAPGGDAYAQARAIAAPFDSVSVCLSKGLGAPVGSVLVGSAELIARAHRIRKMVGGGMRQSGILAAAALFALDHHVERLAQDHARIRALAQGLANVPGLRVTSAQTNILFAEVDGGRGAALLAHLATRGIAATGLIGLRFVAHLDLGPDAVTETVQAVHDFFS